MEPEPGWRPARQASVLAGNGVREVDNMRKLVAL